jgi:glycosyltransferase involved in cell wall biosynthesis
MGEHGAEPPTVVITANAAWNLVNFRKGLIRALLDRGYRVVAAAPEDPAARKTLEALGCGFAPIEMESRTTSVFRDVPVVMAYRRLFRRVRPVAMLGYTIKPNVYGSMAARSAGVPVVNNISGLGTGFMRPGLLNLVVRGLYRVGLARSHTVFFQNAEDRALFVAQRLVAPERTALLPGSGVDLARFHPSGVPDRLGGPTFLMVARLVWDKGVAEFVEAARLVRQERPDARFVLQGFLDVDNRTAVPRTDVERWVAEGVVSYEPPVDDIRPAMSAADVIVLPSYREGTSRVLLEAAALGRPIIATDVPGCREVVDAGTSGLLCRAKDARSLADAMVRMCGLPREELTAMGARGRAKVEREYDERLVIDAYLDRLDRIRSH